MKISNPIKVATPPPTTTRNGLVPRVHAVRRTSKIGIWINIDGITGTTTSLNQLVYPAPNSRCSITRYGTKTTAIPITVPSITPLIPNLSTNEIDTIKFTSTELPAMKNDTLVLPIAFKNWEPMTLNDAMTGHSRKRETEP